MISTAFWPGVLQRRVTQQRPQRLRPPFAIDGVKAGLTQKHKGGFGRIIRQIARQKMQPERGLIMVAPPVAIFGAVLTHGLPDEEREWSLEGIRKGKRAPKEKPDGPDVKLQTCPKCYTIHLPAPHCPTCGHVYPAQARRIEQAEGELVELGQQQLDAIKRQRRIMQGQAQTVEQLVSQGMSRFRASKIIDAREAKAQLVGDVMDLLAAHRARTGQGPYQAFGVTMHDIKRMKPKDLKEFGERLMRPN